MSLYADVVEFTLIASEGLRPASARKLIDYCYYDVLAYAVASIICVAVPHGACGGSHTCIPWVRGQGVCRSDKSLTGF